MISRKILTSSLAHTSIVLFWISGMFFHISYFSNYVTWLKDPLHIKPSAHVVWIMLGQDILNGNTGGYFEGVHISSGLFQVIRSHGITNYSQLKYSSLAAFMISGISLILSYYLCHITPISTALIDVRLLLYLVGCSSLSWCAHLIHISIPITLLLAERIEPRLIMSPQSLMSKYLMFSLFPSFGIYFIFIFESVTGDMSVVGLIAHRMIDSCGSISISVIAVHHLYVGLVMITFAISLRKCRR